jgi:putative ABC transport system permease protein
MPLPEFSTRRSRNEMAMTSKKDRELDEEIRSHLDMSVRDRVERGESREVAEAAARREFGNVGLVKEITREMSGWMWLERLYQDLRYASRLLWRSPGFTVVAILSLALGIGANTAIFQVINAVGLRALPVDDPQTLAYIRIADLTGARGNFNSRFPSVTNPIWEELRRNQQAFASMMAWSGATFNLAPGGLARPARALWVSGRFFETLGVRAAAGRLFTDADDRRGCAPRAVISHAFWQSELGGRPADPRCPSTASRSRSSASAVRHSPVLSSDAASMSPCRSAPSRRCQTAKGDWMPARTGGSWSWDG